MMNNQTKANQHNACAALIRESQAALKHPLTPGEKADLLLDHFPWIQDAHHAHGIIRHLPIRSGPARKEGKCDVQRGRISR
jgi:hypothetical protein